MGTQIRTSQKLAITILVLLFLISPLCCQNSITLAQNDSTLQKIQNANYELERAFLTVLEAEAAGANITDLIIQLNSAAETLALAENSYRIGDLNTAAIKADNVITLAHQMVSIAEEVTQKVLISNQRLFWSKFALTLIGIFIFILVLFLIWCIFKKQYINNLFQTKPEVITQ